ncbi:MAG: hypothetical protein JWO52_2439 [Gammaproteobacteria bacterium]|jgi:hypothetical protein|nr:hypothetical protein [Gammaproteobacteria bacterium]
MSLMDAGLKPLIARRCTRSRTYRREAEESRRLSDIYRLAKRTGDSAARALCHSAGINPNDGRRVAVPEVQPKIDFRLSRDAEKLQP